MGSTSLSEFPIYGKRSADLEYSEVLYAYKGCHKEYHFRCEDVL